MASTPKKKELDGLSFSKSVNPWPNWTKSSHFRSRVLTENEKDHCRWNFDFYWTANGPTQVSNRPEVARNGQWACLNQSLTEYHLPFCPWQMLSQFLLNKIQKTGKALCSYPICLEYQKAWCIAYEFICIVSALIKRTRCMSAYIKHIFLFFFIRQYRKFSFTIKCTQMYTRSAALFVTVPKRPRRPLIDARTMSKCYTDWWCRVFWPIEARVMYTNMYENFSNIRIAGLLRVSTGLLGCIWAGWIITDLDRVEKKRDERDKQQRDPSLQIA